MTSADWIKVLVAIITFLATSLLAWLGTQIIKYRKLAKGAENETIKKTIVDTLSTGLEPIKTDIGDLKNDEAILITSYRKLDPNGKERIQAYIDGYLAALQENKH